MYQHYQDMEQARADAQRHATRAVRAARYASWLVFAGFVIWAVIVALVIGVTLVVRLSR